MTETTVALMGCLGYGAANAKKRSVLAAEMGLSDRHTRKAIHDARVIDHIAICNAQDGKGYFLPQTQAEALEQYKQTMHRGKAVFAQVQALIRVMGMGGQMTLEDLIRETEAIE